jgi:hypothetical protein
VDLSYQPEIDSPAKADHRMTSKWTALLKWMFGCVTIMFSVAGCFSAPAPGVTPTPDVALVAARQTIDAVLLGGNPHTPTSTEPAADVTLATVTAAPTPLATVTPSPDLDATATHAADEIEIAIVTTLTAQVTPTPAPDFAATQAAAMGTAVASTLTAQATPTPTPDLAATQGAQLATAVAKTLTAQPTPTRTATPSPTWTSTPVPVAASPYAELAASLRQRAQRSWVPANYPGERDRFITALTEHLGEFQLPNLGITTRTMSEALRRSDSGDRANAIVNQVWGDWLTKDVGPGRLDAYRSDPAQANLSPFRQLVIRLIQGRQGVLVDNQQHGLHSLFTRREESHVWVDNVNGVIGAINRESFLWP